MKQLLVASIALLAVAAGAATAALQDQCGPFTIHFFITVPNLGQLARF